MNQRRLFNNSAKEVAVDLIGRTIERKWGRGYTTGVIRETGAYEEGNETPSRVGMKYAPGTIFLMPFRGSSLLNVATDREGYPSCVEIRGVQFEDRMITGSGAITKFLSLSGLDDEVLGDQLRITGTSVNPALVRKIKGDAKNCLGYFLLR
tara:strand:+ start:132 stop:584 length:453 start_codon:yes stop_codon:yes gene_type:complete